MKVSIITPTYNSEKTIQRTIDSVINQNFSDIEHIIIDGGSTDKTLEIITKNNGKISKFISEKDKGIYNAINKGISLATGDIIGILNSDDLLANEKIISKIVSCFEETNCDLVYGDIVYQTKDEKSPKIVRYWKSNVFKNNCLKYGWMPPHPSIYCKREIYQQYGVYDEELNISADYDFVLRIFKNSNLKKEYLPEIFVKMDIGGESNKSLKNIFIKSKEDYLAIKRNNTGNFMTVLFKNLRKVRQFNKFRNSKISC
jgi:glycosyltransferase